jgi:excisionase family DNA binding protein
MILLLVEKLCCPEVLGDAKSDIYNANILPGNRVSWPGRVAKVVNVAFFRLFQVLPPCRGHFCFRKENSMYTTTNLPYFMNVTEVADFLRISKKYVYRLIEIGILPCHMIGKRKLLCSNDILEFMERNKHSAFAHGS